MAQGQSGLRQAFGALAYGDYRRFASSLLLTSLSAQLLQTAILWQVYELTGSALLLGLTGLARALPHMVLSLVGGVVADRFDRVKLIQAGQFVNAVVVLLLAALTISGVVEVWHLYVITFLNSAFTAVTNPARTALIPMLVPRDRLVNAIALNSTIGQTSQIMGPTLAGIGISTIGLGQTYGLTVVGTLAAMLVIVGIRTLTTPEVSDLSPWRSFVEGLVFVRSKPVIFVLMGMDFAATVFGSYRALLPIFAEMLQVGPSGYGLLSAAPGVGSLLGATFILSLGDMRYKGLFTVFGILGYCAALVVLSLSPWFWLALVGSALLGTTDAIQMIPRNAVILGVSPDHLRGRVESFRSMLAGGGPPLGYTLAGGLAVVIGPSMALVAGAAACAALVGVVVASRKELRDPELGSVATSASYEPADVAGQTTAGEAKV